MSFVNEGKITIGIKSTHRTEGGFPLGVDE